MRWLTKPTNKKKRKNANTTYIKTYIQHNDPIKDLFSTHKYQSQFSVIPNACSDKAFKSNKIASMCHIALLFTIKPDVEQVEPQ